MTADFIAQLKAEWFERLDGILAVSKALPSSDLKCIELCFQRCCPRVELRLKPPREVTSSMVVLLPFEMEYLMEKTGVPRTVFRRWPLAWTPEVTVEIGMFDLGKICPFLTESLQCSIYQIYPLDCRTYPLLPVLSYPRELEWELSDTCPSAMLLNSKFGEGIKHIWQDLLPVLPQAWWDLYAFADHWKGWPEPVEGRDVS
jgi:Fe-S-cluster containining protein